MGSDKVYWIGDDGDNKSALIARKVYVKGDEIPADDVPQERLDEWLEKGLIAVGDNAAPVIVKDTEGLKVLEAEVRDLKAKLDARAGLEREVTELKKLLVQAKSGKKADKAKEKDAYIKELEGNAVKQTERINEKIKSIHSEAEAESLEKTKKIDALELDNQEKAALIDKLNVDLEAATAPDTGAGPGGPE